MATKKKQDMVTFGIKELSAVNDPAQPHAKALLIKGRKKDLNGSFAKKVAATDVVDGHQHTVVLAGVDEYAYGQTSYSYNSDSYEGHSHGWIRLPGDGIEILESMGHTHTIQTMGKSNEDEPCLLYTSPSPRD